MENLWWLFALCASIISAVFAYSNQIFKMNGLLFMVYRGFLVALITLPVILMLPPIKEPFYYVFCILQGICIAFNDHRFFRAVKAFGAEVASIIQPISISFIFVFWLFFKPSQFQEYCQAPLTSVGIIACLIGITFSIIKIRNSKASGKAFFYLLPMLIILSFGDIFNKKSMYYGQENLTSAIVYYAFITGMICGVSNLFVYIRKKKKISTIFKSKNLKHGAIISVIIIVSMAFKNLAMNYTQNPAYVSAIILLSPIWIIIGNNIYVKLKKAKTGYSHVKPWLAGLLLISVIGLVILNR